MNVESRTRIMEVIAPIGAGTQVVFKRHYRKLKNMQEPIDELLEWLHTFDDLQFTCNHRNVIEKIWQIKSKQQFAVSFVSNAERTLAIKFADALLNDFEMSESETGELLWQLCGANQKMTTKEVYNKYIDEILANDRQRHGINN